MSWSKTHNKSEITVKAKFPVPQIINKWGHTEFVLTPEIAKELKRLYPIKTNLELMGLFAIGFSTLQRFKRELGLKKNEKVIRRKQAKLAKQTCENNGYYDSLRGQKPTQQCIEASKRWWADGNHPLDILKKKNPRKYRKICKDASDKRKAQFADERRRVKIGLDQKTNLLVPQFEYTISQRNHRYNALKRGYILGDVREMMGERYTTSFDKETERSDRFERNLVKDGFTVSRLYE